MRSIRSQRSGRIAAAALALLIGVMCLAACGARENTEEAARIDFVSITQEKAKEIMDSGADYLLLDVRTEEEYLAGHIEGAVLIPYDEIEARAESELPDKERTILVYCRSGNRSKTASQTLAELGYKNVLEIGGIGTWPYGTVS